MPQNLDSISIFFPALNDEATIGKLVVDAVALLESLTSDYEVIVINDGSTDSTGAILDKLAGASQNIKVVHHPTNLGYGGALQTGFRSATKDLIFYTDGDGQYDVKEMEKLLPSMIEGVDVVNGYKIKRSDGFRRKLSGAMYTMISRIFFRLPIRDVDCDFRLLRRAAIQKISLTASSGAICVELVHKLTSAGSVFREVPVHHYPRTHGKSQFFTPGRIVRTLFYFFVLWWSLVISRRWAFKPRPAEDSPVR